MAIIRPNNRFFNRAFRLLPSTPSAVEPRSFASADSCTESPAEQFSLDPARDGVCIAALRRVKLDIGVRSFKDGKSGNWRWTLPPQEDEYPPLTTGKMVKLIT
jgi:hypothetical protein